jgi:hypothetical protein
MNMETELPEENQEEITHSGSDWDNRVLCSDGNCIGVIGSDGRCKECGKPYSSEQKIGNSEEETEESEEETGKSE